MKDGITYYTSADGSTHVDVPEYVLTYTPQVTVNMFDETIHSFLYDGVMCQSNTTMCEGVPDPFDVNWDDLDDAFATAAAVGMSLILAAVLIPLIIIICCCVCVCYCQKVCCFKPRETLAPVAQQPQKADPAPMPNYNAPPGGMMPPPMHHPGMMGPPPMGMGGMPMGGMPMAGGVVHHQSSSTTTTTTTNQMGM